MTSIIILCCNALEYTKPCIQSLKRCTHAYDLIVVDNGSTDGTRAYLETLNATLVANDTNLGFAGGVNSALAALPPGNDVCLLNNDTILTHGWLERLEQALQRHPRLGIVGPRSNAVGGSQMVKAPYRTDSEMVNFARWLRKTEHHRITTLQMVVGMCMLIRRAALDEIGGLDERFATGNFEDNDLCHRATVAGWEIAMVHDSYVHHFGGRTFQALGLDYGALFAENQVRFAEKWAKEAACV